MKLRPADRVFSQWIKKRDNYTCQRCGKYYGTPAQGLDCAHYVSRRNEAVRFDPDNACALDFGCHSYFHQNPKEHELFMIGWLGKEAFDLLQIRRRKVVKKDDKAVILKYKEAL